MKIIDRENYLEYLKKTIPNFLRQPVNYIYLGMALFVLGLYWYEDGFNAMKRVFFLLTTGITITFILTEIFVCFLISKEIRRNTTISLISLLIVLTTINYLLFDTNLRYWSIVLGILLFIPVLISLLITKIRIR